MACLILAFPCRRNIYLVAKVKISTHLNRRLTVTIDLPLIEIQHAPNTLTRQSRGLVYAAIADTFTRQSLEVVHGQMIFSRDILDRCGAWCRMQRLPCPSRHEIAQAMRSMGFQQHKSNGQRMWLNAAWVTEPDFWMTLGEPDTLRRLTQQPAAIPLRVFCELAGVRRSTFYALSARGEAPTSYRRGRRVFISAIDAVEWCAARDRHAAVLCIVDWVEDRRASVSRVKDRVTAWTSAGA